MSLQYLDRLLDEVGSGNLRGHVGFDQIYAHWIHEHVGFKHPRGGQAKFLSEALLINYSGYLQRIAELVVTPDGSHIMAAMIRNMEDLSDSAEAKAPRQFGNLEKSGHPRVRDGLEIVYDRPPKMHRLTEAEIRAERRATGQ